MQSIQRDREVNTLSLREQGKKPFNSSIFEKEGENSIPSLSSIPQGYSYPFSMPPEDGFSIDRYRHSSTIPPQFPQPGSAFAPPLPSAVQSFHSNSLGEFTTPNPSDLANSRINRSGRLISFSSLRSHSHSAPHPLIPSQPLTRLPSDSQRSNLRALDPSLSLMKTC